MWSESFRKGRGGADRTKGIDASRWGDYADFANRGVVDGGESGVWFGGFRRLCRLCESEVMGVGQRELRAWIG